LSENSVVLFVLNCNHISRLNNKSQHKSNEVIYKTEQYINFRRVLLRLPYSLTLRHYLIITKVIKIYFIEGLLKGIKIEQNAYTKLYKNKRKADSKISADKQSLNLFSSSLSHKIAMGERAFCISQLVQ
jgi:hypothetical protein